MCKCIIVYDDNKMCKKLSNFVLQDKSNKLYE